MAGLAPIPSQGIMKTRSASEGIVWISPVVVRMIGPSRGRRAAITPSGIDTTIAAASEIATSVRCSRSRRTSRPINVSAATWASIPNFCARKSAATRSSGTRSSLARAFIAAISAEVIRPSNRARAAKAAGDRDFKSAR